MQSDVERKKMQIKREYIFNRFDWPVESARDKI